jgi:hypothetical protein
MKTLVILVVETSEAIPNLSQVIAQRAYTIDKVENCEALKRLPISAVQDIASALKKEGLLND